VDSLVFWLARPGSGARLELVGPWDGRLWLFSAVALMVTAAFMSAARYAGSRVGPRRRRAGYPLDAALLITGATVATAAFRISNLLMQHLPNEQRSLFIAGYEVHHAFSGTLALVVLQILLLTRCLPLNAMVYLATGIVAGFILDQALYIPQANCTDEAYFGAVSLSGAVLSLIIYSGVIVRCVGSLHSRGLHKQQETPPANLLSHRLRGFAELEHCRTALEAAVRAPVAYLEVDTRTSSDGRIFIHHDQVSSFGLTRRLRFADVEASDLIGLRQINGDPLLTLEQALDIFSHRRHPEQRLCLDIKDFGHEERHLQRVRTAGLEDAVCFVSWIPQTILRLHELKTSAPLVLSHFLVRDESPAVRALARWLSPRLLRLGPFVCMGSAAVNKPLAGLAQGFQHALVTWELSPDIVQALRASGGGVCVPVRMAGPEVTAYCHELGLQLWVFSVEDSNGYRRLATADGPDVVFCDDAWSVLHDAGLRRGDS